MAYIIYTIVISLTLPLWLPVVFLLLWHRKLIGKGRFGFAPKSGTPNNVKKVWLHAASVGEVNVLLPLIEGFKESGYQIYISTMTKTGKEHLAKKCQVAYEHFYLPLDWIGFVSLAFFRLRPNKIVIAETEIWPGLFFGARAFKVPLYLVSARLSDKSIKSYLRWKPFFKPVLKCVEKVYAQSTIDQERYIQLGLENTMVCGNLKNEYLNQILKNPHQPLGLWVAPEIKKVVFGSIRPKEASFVIDTITSLMGKNPHYRFLICPRHFDWLEDFYKDLHARKMPFSVSSKDGLVDDKPILVIDEMGKLLSAYSGSYVAFVGGTLFEEYGGHNMLEPAAFGLPVFHGPFYAEQRTIAEPLLENGASVIVGNAEDFVEEILALQKEDDLYTTRREKALLTVKQEAYSMQILIEDRLFI